MQPILTIVVVAVAILNIMLFVKVWVMTNDVKHILNFLLEKSGYAMKESETTYGVYFEKKRRMKGVLSY